MTEASERSHIIVIDDESAPRESLRILLSSKYDVDLADCVDEGISQLNQRPADLVILDLRMPGKDGLDGLAEIREIDPNVSVVILTGFGSLEAARTAIRHGVTDFIEKPFDVNEMMRIVNDGLARTEAHRRQSKADSVLRNMHDRFGGELDDRMHMAEIGQMSAELAHDLRNPLTIIQGYTQVLAKKLQQTDVPVRYFDVIEQNIRRCNDLVELWQGLSSNLVRDSTQFDAAQLITELVRDLEDMDDQVTFKLQLNPCMMRGDRVQLYRAFANLVSNAQHALRGGGEIGISSAQVDSKIEIEITDNGCGMSEQTLARIFDPFYTAKHVGKGNGLGMFIVRKVVEMHGGAISVQSQPETGTTVFVQLPNEPVPQAAADDVASEDLSTTTA